MPYYVVTATNGLYERDVALYLGSGNFFDYTGVGGTYNDDLYLISAPLYLNLDITEWPYNCLYLYDWHADSFLDYFGPSLFYD